MSEVKRLSENSTARTLALAVLLASGCKAKASGEVETATPEQAPTQAEADAEATRQAQLHVLSTAVAKYDGPVPDFSSGAAPADAPTISDHSKVGIVINPAQYGPGTHTLNLNLEDPGTFKRITDCVEAMGGTFEFVANDKRTIVVKSENAPATPETPIRSRGVTFAVKAPSGQLTVMAGNLDLAEETVAKCEEALAQKVATSEAPQQ